MTIKNSIFTNGAFLILALGLSGCGESSSGTKVVTAWEVQPPYFKLYDNQTDKESKTADIKRMDLDSVLLDLATTDELMFVDAKKYPGSILSATTLCTGEKDAVYKQSFRMTLKTANSVYRFLPEEMLLLPTDQLKSFKCSVHFVAQNTNGSIHDFGKDIHFKIFGENQSLLVKLQDETQKEENSEWPDTALISIQRARYHFLPKKNAGEIYRLKCSSFESSAVNADQLLQLIEKNLETENIQQDQFCRLLIHDQNGVIHTTKLFVLRFFDYRDYVENISYKTSAKREYDSIKLHLGAIKLANRTKVPAFFSVKKQNMVVTVHEGTTAGQRQAPGGLGFLEPYSRDQIRELPDRTVFILNPGQSITVTFDVSSFLANSRISVSWIDRVPTLDLIEKKSWEDPNEKVLTSIPFMNESTMEIEIR
ncbi:MAG: hypothetical protein AABZ31_04425 [Bdellovibrionota bacterium]